MGGLAGGLGVKRGSVGEIGYVVSGYFTLLYFIRLIVPAGLWRDREGERKRERERERERDREREREIEIEKQRSSADEMRYVSLRLLRVAGRMM